MAHRRRQSSFQKVIDHKEWNAQLSGNIDALDLAVGAEAVGDVGLAFLEPLTILRTRGRVICQLDAAAADERATVAVGLILVGDEAFSAGVGALPKPFEQGGALWLWFDYLQVTSLSEGAAVPTDFLVDRVVIDSKAMRKVRSNDSLVFMAEIVESTDAGGSLDIDYAARLLFGF